METIDGYVYFSPREFCAALRVSLTTFREDGLMPGVFRWIDSLGQSIDAITSFVLHRDVKQLVPDEDGWKRWEPLPDTHVTLIFSDGKSAMKTFTPEQLRGEL